MEHSEALKSMLQDIINDRHEQATITMHDYFVSKTREVSGLSVVEEDLDEAKKDAVGGKDMLSKGAKDVDPDPSDRGSNVMTDKKVKAHNAAVKKVGNGRHPDKMAKPPNGYTVDKTGLFAKK